METLNSLLSNDIGYLNALRHAPPLPPAAPLVTPPGDIKLPTNKFKIPTWGWILVGVGVSVFAAYKWRAYQDKKKSNTL
ncbi:MAG: hypothetical protein RLZZ546_1631 [Bacteroidota bacterium]|jgi:hypothetical protein